jgi:spheroidene monooxygenase
MIASFHLLQHRRRVVAPAKRWRVDDIPGLCFWRPLNVGGDFAWFREHPTRRALYPRLRPDFHRWGYYAIWEKEADLERFLAGSEVGRAWHRSAVEAYHMWLRPLRARGPWEGTRLLQGSESAAAADGPVAYLTRLDLSPRATLAMWGSAAPNILRYLPDGDALLLGVPLVDRPYTQPVSFSLWRSHEAARTFARGENGHRRAVRRLQRAQPAVVPRFSSAGFEPYRSQGTWRGRDPRTALHQEV